MSNPSSSRPSPSTFGLWPVATSSRSASSTSSADKWRRSPRSWPPRAGPDGRHARRCPPDRAARRRIGSGIGIELREDPVVDLDNRNPGAQAVKELRELDTDRAAAEHDEALRDGVSPDCFPVRPVVDGLEPFDRRRGRRRSGRDDRVRVLRSPAPRPRPRPAARRGRRPAPAPRPGGEPCRGQSLDGPQEGLRRKQA